jgi:hypothetical protein
MDQEYPYHMLTRPPKLEFSGQFIKTREGSWHNLNYIVTFFVNNNEVRFHRQDQTSWILGVYESHDEAQLALNGFMVALGYGQ